MGADRPLDTCSAVVKSWTWGDVPSHHLCSGERGIPLHPWQPPRVTVPPRTPQGTRPSLPARVSPPRAAKAELGQPHWVTLTRGGLSCSPPKKELLLGVLGSSQAETGEGGGRGWISTGGAAWGLGKARRAAWKEPQRDNDHPSSPRCPCTAATPAQKAAVARDGVGSFPTSTPRLGPHGRHRTGSATTTTSGQGEAVAVGTGSGRCPPVVSQVTSVHWSVPGCPSAGLVCSCSPDI